MASTPPVDVVRALDVSRETLERLGAFVDLLLDWNTRINLISRRTFDADEVWRRHVLDSAQALPLVTPSPDRIVDLGSGAGFPGLVLAVLGVERLELVESSAKKCRFLHAAAAALGLDVVIHNLRVEDMPRQPADVIIARAVAPIPRLLGLIKPLLTRRTRVVLFKGTHVEAELTEAHKIWKMSVTRTPSITDSTGVILTLEDVRHGPETVRSRPRAKSSRHRQPEGRRR